MAQVFDKDGNTINPAEEDGNLAAVARGTDGYYAQTGKWSKDGDNASHTLTLPANTTHVRLTTTGGLLRWEIGDSASPASCPLATGAVETIPVKQGTTILCIYVPAGTVAYATFLQRVAR